MIAAIPPDFWASAPMCRASVVLPEDSGPKTSMIRPRGMPFPPRAMSRLRLPVEMQSMVSFWEAPSGMIAPSPNDFSIC